MNVDRSAQKTFKTVSVILEFHEGHFCGSHRRNDQIKKLILQYHPIVFTEVHFESEKF